ncbi:MAG TPA: glycosyltransferase [Solirubrobacteraceae bacterium]|nr:glycosyltransferase [Solirubrobacteraceae bacterium]
MRRLRVLYLIDQVIDTGGAERFALGLATHLPADRFELWVCSTRGAEPAALEQLRDAGVRHVHLGRRGKLDVWRFRRLVALLRHQRFDILHAHMFGSNLWGCLIGRACRVPIVIAHEQTWSYEGEPLRRWLDGHVIGRLATRFVAVSTRDAERMVTIEGVPVHKIVMIPNAYVPRPGASDTDLRGQLGLGPEVPLLVVVAQLRPQKALEVLLDAMPRVHEAVPETHLAIAGDGECRAALEARSRALGLTDRVHFLGRRSDVDAILQAGDLAVMSSDFEGTPLVAYECIANRTPLVATAVGGLPDIIDDGRTGRLVAPRDPAALAAAIVELLNDPGRRAAIAAAAAEGEDEFTIATATSRFVALYEQLARTTPACT